MGDKLAPNYRWDAPELALRTLLHFKGGLELLAGLHRCLGLTHLELEVAAQVTQWPSTRHWLQHIISQNPHADLLLNES